MNPYYRDILDRIAESPKWFDEHAVPRYEPFTPNSIADIGADEIVLFEIACQSCHHLFTVTMSQSWIDRAIFERTHGTACSTLRDLIRDKTLHYGDPPNILCCLPGPTMNCLDIKVVEYWKRDERSFNWNRDPELETPLADYDEIAPRFVPIRATMTRPNHP